MGAQASKLGGLVDSTWEAIGGGPADLSFPDEWLGVWDVTSTLVSVELPEGEAVVPNIAAVRRAEQQDLAKPMQYQVAFMRNDSGKVVYDRRFNTAALLATYYGSNVDFAGRIQWDAKDPNSLILNMPGDMSVRTRVMRRSESQIGTDRLETSEFLQQVLDSGDPARPRVKASQCFTKYKWREEAAAEAAGGPAIVATQVVSDYLTPFDSEVDAIRYANRPVTTYTYRMAFSRHHDAPQVASAVSLS
ncbi:hypothetical protein OEZ85_001679 [Tetradesmus obliquus]|uniref:DUF6816 domain-containing protein n=1 Tax=Tetradesmus obliquus TaxID=3088 RepID=A0ABY8U0P6_TETOB|nr:hypothetical protein OEZ85_001679 [Tetradesmus obliquus]